MLDSLKIVGAKGQRQKNDYYPTPPECTEALIRWLNIRRSSTIWEPAAGEGNMVTVLKQAGFNVIATDIQTGTDFLTTPLIQKNIDWIITNPPFSLSVEFIKHCAELHKPFALLLKSQYWHSAKRKAIFDQIKPTAILPLTWRPDFLGKGASLMDMLWTIWEVPQFEGNTIYMPLSKPGVTNSIKEAEDDHHRNERQARPCGLQDPDAAGMDKADETGRI